MEKIYLDCLKPVSKDGIVQVAVKEYRDKIQQIGITLKNEKKYPDTRLHQCDAQVDDIISIISKMFIE